MLATTALLWLQVPQATPQVRPPDPKRNVLLIVVDDVGVDQLGCYAANYPSLALVPCTPNIDQLAATGMRFTNAWAAPVCSPTRAQILTGKPAVYTGVGTVIDSNPSLANNSGLQLDELTVAKMLTSSYATVALGKWHVSDPAADNGPVPHPIGSGFDYFAGSLYNLDPEYNDWTKVLEPGGVVLTNYAHYATTDTAQETLSQIAVLPEPWLIYASFNACHSPTHCPSDKGFSACPGSGSCAQSWCQDCNTLLASSLCTPFPQDACQTRSMVHALDSKLGQVLQAVDPTDTVVILVADNGTERRATVPPFDDNKAKGTLFQGGINVPLIVRAPGAVPGVCHELVSTTDLLATIADFARIAPPPDRHRDSVSLCQYLGVGGCGSQAVPRTFVFSEHFWPNFVPEANDAPPLGYDAQFHHRAIRNAKFKLIDFRSTNQQTGACQTALKFFRLATTPPQDPALGPDPHELVDLMPNQANWTQEELDAFTELSAELASNHPKLPVGICP